MISKQTKIAIKKVLYPFLNIFSKKYIVKRVNQSPEKKISVVRASLSLAKDIEYLKYQKLIAYDGSPKHLEADIDVSFYTDVYVDLDTGVMINSAKDIIRGTLKNEDRTETDHSRLTSYLHIDGLVSVINPHLNVGYFHIWFDGLIKLYYLSLLDQKITIVVAKEAPTIYHQVLELYKDKFSIAIVDGYRFIKAKKACCVHHLYWSKHAPYFSSNISDFFKNRIIATLDDSSIKTYDRIFIKRKNSIRSILNDDEVEQLFLSYGFKVISFEDFTVFEQAYLVNRAKVIAGIHGAGFGNLIFADSKLTVIELQNHAVVPSFFFMSYQLRLKYFPIFSLTTNVDEIRDPHNEREMFYSQKLAPVRYDIGEIQLVLEKI
ncbi:glycosyltransferase family 61 protein [Aequorivita viscosa]|uniref:Glycosyltransferase 61 catalytic domain-containing protein n=1 Tax=Aequorivita viscosa TaxID=797419 RepID=A0A1M6GIB5_9FLAO|nr:glycosyltransferase family 61 protein [Aequorivita viscosa]SDW84139.1 Protein of unknown function [Aequorivita viscosa]SHJ09695.1 Protein of unknown function [Aequorivita viscosa]